MATLPDMLRAEIARCETIARHHAALGSTGAFARALVDEALREAQRVLRAGDVHAIEQMLQRLRSFREVTPDLVPPAPPRPPRPSLADSAAVRAGWLQPGAGRPGAWVQPRPVAQEQYFTWGRRVA